MTNQEKQIQELLDAMKRSEATGLTDDDELIYQSKKKLAKAIIDVVNDQATTSSDMKGMDVLDTMALCLGITFANQVDNNVSPESIMRVSIHLISRFVQSFNETCGSLNLTLFD